jgi:imidazolonepropionase-like amidohydrolase
MTTLNPARFYGREQSMGSVEVGKNADLVLLDGNPMENVKNLHRIAAVVLDGAYYPRAILDEKLRTLSH